MNRCLIFIIRYDRYIQRTYTMTCSIKFYNERKEKVRCNESHLATKDYFLLRTDRVMREMLSSKEIKTIFLI